MATVTQCDLCRVTLAKPNMTVGFTEPLGDGSQQVAHIVIDICPACFNANFRAGFSNRQAVLQTYVYPFEDEQDGFRRVGR